MIKNTGTRRGEAILQRQLKAFRKKFGRDPGPGDPIFFDPDAETPQHLDADEMGRQVVMIMKNAGIRPELAYAYQKPGLSSWKVIPGAYPKSSSKNGTMPSRSISRFRLRPAETSDGIRDLGGEVIAPSNGLLPQPSGRLPGVNLRDELSVRGSRSDYTPVRHSLVATARFPRRSKQGLLCLRAIRIWQRYSKSGSSILKPLSFAAAT
jgi:hypothetical protein